MSSTDNPPSLALSDIMYHMSPSPAPPDEHSGLAAATNDFGSGDGSKDTFISSEVKSSTDVAGIRRRLTELGFPVAGQLNSLEKSVDFASNANISPREKELLDMVISLSQAVAVDPSQLERQAETIANLTTHRDFLAEQMEEERERWQAEREGWDRAAEALLSQRNKPSKSEDMERVRASFESENRMLRVKLQDYQKRQASLESELTRVKPLLFLQPFSISRQDKGKSREFAPKSNLVSVPEDREMKESQDKTPYYQSQSQSKIINSPATPSTSKPISATQPPLPPRRSRDHSTYSRSLGKRNCQTFTSDAYMDHLLLAARKIGRKRAAIVTGIVQHAEREKEALVYEQEQIRSQKEQVRMEQDRQERIASGAFGAYYRTGPEASTSTPQQHRGSGHSKTATPLPRTPKRNSALHYSTMGTGSVPGSAGPNSTANAESSLVYVNVNTATSSYDSPWAGSGVMGTPGQIKSALNRQNGRTANSEKGGIASNPTTPLASLLDAALMMNEDGRSGTKQRGKMNGKGRPLEEPESPVPKRRKTSTGKPAGAGGLGLDRVKSALDVLADQADQASAVFNETDQSDKRPSTSNNTNEPELNGKGKGKAKEKLPTQDSEDVPMDEQQNGPSAFGGKELIFVTSSGRERPRRESSVTTAKAKAGATAVTTSTSRPVRQASRKRAASPDHNAATAIATGSTTRASARARGGGRSRASTSKSRSAAPAAPGLNADGRGSGTILADGTARMISPPGGLRVITPGPRYSPLDEALALVNSRKTTPENGTGDSITTTRDCAEHAHATQSHPHSPPSFLSGSKPIPPQSQSGEPKTISGLLRPVSVGGWGIRNPPTVDESDSSSPMRGTTHAPAKPKDSRSSARPSSDPPEPPEIVPIPRSPRGTVTKPDVFLSNDSPRHVNGDTHEPKRPPTPTAVDVNGPDAHAETDDDPDAEGEQEDGEGEGDDDDNEAEAENEGESAKHTSRSKSPPPPDPPPPGPDNGSPPDQQDDHDTDADAEGEMDLDDAEDPPPPSSGGGGIASTCSSVSSYPGWKATTDSADDHSFELATTFFMFVISIVTPSFHLEVPTPLSLLNPTSTRPLYMFPDISENRALGNACASTSHVSATPRLNKSRISLALE